MTYDTPTEMPDLTNFSTVAVPADGNCFYHAFIKGTGLKTTLKDLRAVVAKKIFNDPDLYDDLVTEWIDHKVINDKKQMNPLAAATRILTTNDWATSTIVHVVALEYKTRITVVQKTGNSLVCQDFPARYKLDKQRRFRKRVYIKFDQSREHYELLLPWKPEMYSRKNGRLRRVKRVQYKPYL